jgi:alpha,alpha-trehalase
LWLAQALAGEVDQARATFQRAAAYVGGAELIGNYPQAFSDIGLVNAAWAITQAEEAAVHPTE